MDNSVEAIHREQFPLDGLAERIHKIAVSHGFWPPEGRNFGEMMALIMSEAAEALEQHRIGNPAFYYTAKLDGEDLPVYHGEDGDIYFEATNARVPKGARLKPEGAVVELADCVIRCFDTMHHLVMTDESLDNFTVDDIISMKVDYNRGRPHKHGKAY